jgi:hypothetical protein
VPAEFELYRLYTPLALSPKKPGANRWAEKTPRNILSFAALLEYFGEDVRLIHIVRDGRDATTSRHLRHPTSYYYQPERWAEIVSYGLTFKDHPQVMLVRYEDLVLDFTATVTRLCEFLGESVDASILHWFDHASVRTHTAWRGSVRPLQDSSIGRWRRPEHAEQVELFRIDPRAPTLLRDLGYQWES